MFKQNKINFQPIEDVVHAAKLLQDAGADADSHHILLKLAKDLIKDLKK